MAVRVEEKLYPKHDGVRRLERTWLQLKRHYQDSWPGGKVGLIQRYRSCSTVLLCLCASMWHDIVQLQQYYLEPRPFHRVYLSDRITNSVFPDGDPDFNNCKPSAISSSPPSHLCRMRHQLVPTQQAFTLCASEMQSRTCFNWPPVYFSIAAGMSWSPVVEHSGRPSRAYQRKIVR